MEKVKKMLEEIVKCLVNQPDKIEITTKQDEMGVLFSVKVAKEDMGLLIGKGGSHARAIREVLGIVGFKEKIRASMKIFDPERDNTNYANIH